jgi:hyperosmotically inducible protein
MSFAVSLFLLWSIAGGQEARQAGPQEPNRLDKQIAMDVARELRRYPSYSVFDHVEVAVEDGVVTLKGKVTMGYKAEEMEKRAAEVEGVKEVSNQIEVLPVSINDDQLRRALADRIYRDSLFTGYSIQPDPPIHIVVENARVTLTGVVRNEIERRKAESIARSTFGVLTVDNQLRVESESSSTS